MGLINLCIFSLENAVYSKNGIVFCMVSRTQFRFTYRKFIRSCYKQVYSSDYFLSVNLSVFLFPFKSVTVTVFCPFFLVVTL